MKWPLGLGIGYLGSQIIDGAHRLMVPLYFSDQGIDSVTISFLMLSPDMASLALSLFFRLRGRTQPREPRKIYWIHGVGFFTCLLPSLWAPDLWSKDYLLLFGAVETLRGGVRELWDAWAARYTKQQKWNAGQSQLAAQWLYGTKEMFRGLGLVLGGVSLGLWGWQMSHALLVTLTLLPLFFGLKELSFQVLQSNISGVLSPLPPQRKKLHYLALSRGFLQAGRELWVALPLPIYAVQVGWDRKFLGIFLASGLILLGVLQPLLGGFFLRAKIQGKKLPLRPWLVYGPIFLCMICLLSLALPLENPWILGSLILLYHGTCALALVPHNHFQLKFTRRKRASVDIAYYKISIQMGRLSSFLFSGVLYAWAGIGGCLWGTAVCSVLAALSGLKAQKKKSTFMGKLF